MARIFFILVIIAGGISLCKREPDHAQKNIREREWRLQFNDTIPSRIWSISQEWTISGDTTWTVIYGDSVVAFKKEGRHWEIHDSAALGKVKDSIQAEKRKKKGEINWPKIVSYDGSYLFISQKALHHLQTR